MLTMFDVFGRRAVLDRQRSKSLLSARLSHVGQRSLLNREPGHMRFAFSPGFMGPAVISVHIQLFPKR